MRKILFILLFGLSILSKSIVAQNITSIKTDVCIIGAGSGGIGAALAASRAGSDVVLIEKQGRIGGTSTMAFVNNWEPGVGCDYSKEIYDRLKLVPGAVGISKPVHGYQKDEPYGINLLDPNGHYNQTLRRSDLPYSGGVLFDFEKFDETVLLMIEETGKCKLLLNTAFSKATSDGKTVKTIEAVSVSGEKFEITAKVFIDCTGGVQVCRDLGAQTMLGAESQSQFNELSAPEQANNELNAISLCYQIRKADNPVQGISAPEGTYNYGLVAVSSDIPGKPNLKSINPLGILDGKELIRLGYDSAYHLAKKIVDDHWARLQKYPHFKGYEFDCYAPMLGIRESYRVVGEYVLNQNDLLAGYKNQEQKDFIALADHPMDVHGKNSTLSKLTEAYGIPYFCLIPKGWTNLLVACRGASFTQLAASSCRLSRTMIAIGHAAGFAASIAARENLPVLKVPVERVQAEMNLKLRAKEDKMADPKPISKCIGKNTKRYLISDNGSDKIFILNADGEISWEYPVSQCQDLQQLPSGNILFTYYQKREGSIKGGVCEITPEKKEVFRYEIDGEVHSCQRLKNGNTILTDNNNARLIEVNPKGEVVNSLALNTKVKGHSAIRMIRVLNNGNYLVCQEEDQLVVEYNPKGKMVNSFKSPGKCFAAIRLKNGNTLISDGSVCSVREVNNKGKEVWKISKEDFPELKLNWLTGIQELPNGNYLICNWLGHGKYGEGIPMFEVTKDKKIVWYFTDNHSIKSLSNVTPIK
jgi:hypothetical protein